MLAPSAEDVARALAGRDRIRLQPAGACAANALGLSDQVPAKAVFLTDGPARTVKLGSTTIPLRRTTPTNREAAGRLSGLLIQALREPGQEHVTRQRRDHLKRSIRIAPQTETFRFAASEAGFGAGTPRGQTGRAAAAAVRNGSSRRRAGNDGSKK